jgi:hypothetical protein
MRRGKQTEVTDMDFPHRLIALPVALALAAGAYAGDPKTEKTANHSDAVETLKSRLGTSAAGFEVKDVQVAPSGASCITYSVNNSTGGETRAKAVVQGDKVLRSTSRSDDFQEAWNTNCVANQRASN